MNLTIDASLFTDEHIVGRAIVRGLVSSPIHIQLAGLNAAGSIKLRPALRMITDLEAQGCIHRDTQLIESSSGNLGVALSAVCANRGYSFTCVTDPNCSTQARKAMVALGARVLVVDQRDKHGGFLNTRIALIQRMCAENPAHVWVNQYANPSNWRAHQDVTARQIHAAFPRVDWLLIGTGTTGTLMGCGRYFKQHSPHTRIVAIDAAGSVIFGGMAAQRHIPGIGATRSPEILDAAYLDEILYVHDTDAIRMCRALAQCGLLVGGSTGSAVAGAAMLNERIGSHDTVVVVSADMGEKYLDSIYDDDWVKTRFPEL